ncbi:hypothetical protein VF21_05055 [Pseudogymnoascus sp. 05NY08]|nr:hypothetical protein VF21_05055 [Pseudogymnoascus sp. 05NY08]
MVWFPSRRVTTSSDMPGVRLVSKRTNVPTHPAANSAADGSVVTSSSHLLYLVPLPTLAAATTAGFTFQPTAEIGAVLCIVVVEDEMVVSRGTGFTRKALVQKKYSEFGIIVECGL